MRCTLRELAQILAALRYSAEADLTPLGHFDGVEGGQLTQDEIDSLCDRLNCDTEPSHAYTVVGVFPGSDWDASPYDASFVETVPAEGPAQATHAAKLQAAWNRCTEEEEESDQEHAQRVADLVDSTTVFAVFEGSLLDLHDPLAKEE